MNIRLSMLQEYKVWLAQLVNRSGLDMHERSAIYDIDYIGSIDQFLISTLQNCEDLSNQTLLDFLSSAY